MKYNSGKDVHHPDKRRDSYQIQQLLQYSAEFWRHFVLRMLSFNDKISIRLYNALHCPEKHRFSYFLLNFREGNIYIAFPDCFYFGNMIL